MSDHRDGQHDLDCIETDAFLRNQEELGKLLHDRSLRMASEEKALLRMVLDQGASYDQVARLTGEHATTVNERMVCIRRVIIEPRYRGLGLARRLVAETMPMTGSPMVEAVSVMGRVHPFFERAGMQAFAPTPDAKTERMAAALEAVAIGEELRCDRKAIDTKIEQLDSAANVY